MTNYIVGLMLLVIAGAGGYIYKAGNPGAQAIKHKRWALIWMDKHALPKKSRASLRFGKNKMYGNASCNGYSGKFQANKSAIKFSETMRTSKACSHLKTETIYLKLLHKANKYKVIKNQLHLLDGKRILMRFQFVPKTPNAPLERTKWQLETWISSIAPNLPAMAMHSRTTRSFKMILSKGVIKGHTACAPFTAAYGVKNNNIQISGIKHNVSKCKNNSAKKEHLKFIDILKKAKTFKIKAHGLRLSVHKNLELDFRKVK